MVWITFVGPFSEVAGAPALKRLDASDRTVLLGWWTPTPTYPSWETAPGACPAPGGKTCMEDPAGRAGILRAPCGRSGRPRPMSCWSRLTAPLPGSCRRRHDLREKSGYGLDVESEIKQLSVLQALAREGPQTVGPHLPERPLRSPRSSRKTRRPTWTFSTTSCCQRWPGGVGPVLRRVLRGRRIHRRTVQAHSDDWQGIGPSAPAPQMRSKTRAGRLWPRRWAP